MPFHNMSDEDVLAIVSFLRAQPPVRNQVPADEWTVFGKIIRSVSATFKPREGVNPPKTAPEANRRRNEGSIWPGTSRIASAAIRSATPTTFEAVGPEFAGGWEMEPMPLPGADPETWFRTPNITPVYGGGLKKFPDRATFVARFKVGGRKHAGSPMPWEAFASMSEDDIGALYEFLQTLQPVEANIGESPFRKTD